MTREQTDLAWFFDTLINAVPSEKLSALEFAKKYVRLSGPHGAYDPSITPWTTPLIEKLDDPTWRILDFCKPVQSGGSSIGEIAACRWVTQLTGADLQWNWEDNDKASDRWDKRIFKILDSCQPVKRLFPAEYKKGLVIFPNCNLTVQGQYESKNLDSETITKQINEELHNWKPGHLDKAHSRLTAVWNAQAMQISNASFDGDQFHVSHSSGTYQHWEVRCPGCGQYHIMRMRWEETEPQLGGMRYDKESCLLSTGEYSYEKMKSSIRLQMPCGYAVRDDLTIRRALSLSGRYGAPTNLGAAANHLSYTLESVSVDYIPFISLMQDKHRAWAALRSGSPDGEKIWIKYLQEKECVFYSPEKHLFRGEILVTSGTKKNRDGMKNRVGRLWAADWQQGYKSRGELSHYWLYIEDVDSLCNGLTVFEGVVHSEKELLATLEEYDAIEHGSGVIDASKNTKAILEFCYRNRLNAVMGNQSFRGSFLHQEDGQRRFYDEGSTIAGKLNVANVYHESPSKDGWIPDPKEPVVISYNRAGMLANSFFISEHQQRVIEAAKKENRIADASEYIAREIPSDVSEEFRAHMGAWIRIGPNDKKTEHEANTGTERFKRIRQDDHLRQCVGYVDMLKDWCGLLGDRMTLLGVEKPNEIPLDA